MKIYPAIQESSIDKVNEMAKVIYDGVTTISLKNNIIGIWMHIILSDSRPTNAKLFVILLGVNDLNVSP